ncbi:hypothetical protein AX17_003944 [Amanita inopinata Kibby_2008]|nr:hypothetical protein AX17_003944 [Amanita inopinata Kibby_2008]
MSSSVHFMPGIYQSDLFRALPNRRRLQDLIQIFDSSHPHRKYRSIHTRTRILDYHSNTLLHLESTQDICALLSDYLCSLPEPILSPFLFDAIWEWGGLNKEEDDQTESFATLRQRDIFPLMKSYTDPSEATRIAIVQHLLHLLPFPSFSLLVYLLAFFSQVVMMCDVNGIGVQDLGRLFGKCVFGGDRLTRSASGDLSALGGRERRGQRDGRIMMQWFLKRWGPLSDGIFDVVLSGGGGGARPGLGRSMSLKGKFKPKSPIDFDKAPSPSAWSFKSTKRRGRDEDPRGDCTPTQLSPFEGELERKRVNGSGRVRVRGQVQQMQMSPLLRFQRVERSSPVLVDQSKRGESGCGCNKSVDKERESDILDGPSLSRKSSPEVVNHSGKIQANAPSTTMPATSMRASADERSLPELSPMSQSERGKEGAGEGEGGRLSVATSIYSAPAIDERLLDVSFPETFSHHLDASPTSANQDPPPSLPRAQAQQRIRHLERELEKRDAAVQEAKREARRVVGQWFGDLERRLEGLEGVLGGQRGPLGGCGDGDGGEKGDGNGNGEWKRQWEVAMRERQEAFDIVDEIRKLLRTSVGVGGGET